MDFFFKSMFFTTKMSFKLNTFTHHKIIRHTNKQNIDQISCLIFKIMDVKNICIFDATFL